VDAEDLQPGHTGTVRAAGEEIGEAGETEQGIGPGVMAEVELEVPERAVPCGEGDAPTGGSPAALAAPSTVEGTHEADGTEAEDPGTDGERGDVVALAGRNGGALLPRRVRSARDRRIVVMDGRSGVCGRGAGGDLRGAAVANVAG